MKFIRPLHIDEKQTAINLGRRRELHKYCINMIDEQVYDGLTNWQQQLRDYHDDIVSTIDRFSNKFGYTDIKDMNENEIELIYGNIIKTRETHQI